MKKIILTAVVVLCLSFANAQESIVKANPLAFLGGSDLVSYEHKLGENTSFVLGAGIGGFSIGGAKYSSFGAEAQYRYYFNEALKGLYAGGQIGYTSGKVTSEEYKFSFTYPYTTLYEYSTTFSSFELGAKGGYQWVWDSGFCLDLNLGIAYNNFSYKDSGTGFDSLSASGVLPNFGLGLGYAF